MIVLLRVSNVGIELLCDWPEPTQSLAPLKVKLIQCILGPLVYQHNNLGNQHDYNFFVSWEVNL